MRSTRRPSLNGFAAPPPVPGGSASTLFLVQASASLLYFFSSTRYTSRSIFHSMSSTILMFCTLPSLLNLSMISIHRVATGAIPYHLVGRTGSADTGAISSIIACVATVNLDHVCVPTCLASLFTVCAHLAASRVFPRMKNTFSSPGVDAIKFALGFAAVALLDARPLHWLRLRLPILVFEVLDIIIIMLMKVITNQPYFR